LSKQRAAARDEPASLDKPKQMANTQSLPLPFSWQSDCPLLFLPLTIFVSGSE
jgi:hypothetical protein